MKFLQTGIVLCFLLLWQSSATLAQTISRGADANYFVIRHAEKDTGDNPPISSIGKQRAADLLKALYDESIDRVLVTKYHRTAMTGDSLRLYKKLDTAIYAADMSGAGLQKCLERLPITENNFLIIGHSNTVPGMIRRLGVKDFLLNQLPDEAYDRLYIIRIRQGIATLEEKRYGLATP